MLGIKEVFINLAQVTVGDKAAVTKLMDANRHLAAQVSAQANNMTTKDAAMETMQNIIIQLQGELKTLKEKHSVQSTKNANPSSYKKRNCWRSKYCWTHGRVVHAGEECIKKA